MKSAARPRAPRRRIPKRRSPGRRLRGPPARGTPLRDRGVDSSMSTSDSSGRTVEVARHCHRRVADCRGPRRSEDRRRGSNARQEHILHRGGPKARRLGRMRGRNTAPRQERQKGSPLLQGPRGTNLQRPPGRLRRTPHSLSPLQRHTFHLSPVEKGVKIIMFSSRQLYLSAKLIQWAIHFNASMNK